MLSHNTIALNIRAQCQSAAGSYHNLAAMDYRASLLCPHQLLDECRCSQSSSVSGLASRRRTAEAFREVCIGVLDTGIGIAPEHLGRIFEEPYRVDWRDDRHGSSQGLASRSSSTRLVS
jgi:signal transduction histidine kinase